VCVCVCVRKDQLLVRISKQHNADVDESNNTIYYVRDFITTWTWRRIPSKKKSVVEMLLLLVFFSCSPIQSNVTQKLHSLTLMIQRTSRNKNTHTKIERLAWPVCLVFDSFASSCIGEARWTENNMLSSDTRTIYAMYRAGRRIAANLCCYMTRGRIRRGRRFTDLKWIQETNNRCGEHEKR